MDSDLNDRILQRGRRLFDLIASDTPSLFNKSRWTGKLLDWCMDNEAFKVQLLRFVDVFPTLNTPEALNRHLEEYFSGPGQQLPSIFQVGAKGASMGGRLGGLVMSKAIRFQINQMASQFIIGETGKQAVKALSDLRKKQYAFVLDALGEAAVNEEEAEGYLRLYLELLDILAEAQWSAIGSETGLDWGTQPICQISIKVSALYSQMKPADFEGSVEGALKRVRPIWQRVVAMGGALCIDMESYATKDITLEIFRRLRAESEGRSCPHLGIVIQAYLKDSENDVRDLIDWLKREELTAEVRLVKGAYWDYETIHAAQCGREAPVWGQKPETDAAFERCSRLLLENHQHAYFACASHNLRSVAAVMEVARELNVPDDRYEFQVLYGMAEPVRRSILKESGRLRLYCPYGEMVPGMAYLVRRLLENTANESFLRQSFVENEDRDRLLADPATLIETPVHSAERAAFTNEPEVDFTVEAERRAIPDAIAMLREGSVGKTYPLKIGGKSVETGDLLPSLNPNQPSEVIAQIHQAGVEETEAAVQAALKAFPSWRDTSPDARAKFLNRAADVCRRRAHELAAWQVLEVGKQWDQAHADVAEAIDFLDYYAAEMRRVSHTQWLGNVPGETNAYFYEAKGPAAVIAPWNFPLAISMGMVSAAIVAGNPVIYKPSSVSSVIGHHIAEVFEEVGLPEGVFNYLPGRSRVMGDYLVEHPGIAVIAFTGSMEVGLRILQKASVVHPGQRQVKRVIAEMGGKNAIIIDDDADLDEAVPAILYSAFGFQGQKCSACSRLIVLDAIYDRLVDRLVKAARCYKVGSPEDPGNHMGAVVEKAAQERILEAAALAIKEGKLLYQSPVPDTEGYYVPLTIVEGITPEHRTAQEEIFGPVLAVMRASDFDDALRQANDSRFALTGAVFSRSPAHLDRARREFRVGNLYLNRGSTGAVVGRQAFGGARMSGVGSKAGGPDYLLQFMDPRTVTENTMRRGFAPESD